MGRFNQGRSNFSGRREDKPEMFDAVCDECGKDCKVPFRPTGNKPIFCSQCFEKKGGPSRDSRDDGRGRRSFDRDSSRSFGRRDEKPTMYKAVCDACGETCEVPFSPSPDKPIYCSKCFETKGGKAPKGGDNTALIEKLDSITEKLDKLLLALEPKVVAKKVAVKKAAVKKVAAKKVVKKVAKKKE